MSLRVETLIVNQAQFLQWCQPVVAPLPLSTTYLRKPLIMGVLNVTPNSFSDGGHFLDTSHACKRAEEMIAHGADIIDIGGESTRPGAECVSADEELARVIPVIERIRTISDISIAIDTSKAAVMYSAVAAGATIINDIRALTGEGVLDAAAELKVPVCLMHMQGTPKTMQDNPHYAHDIVDEINQFFQQRIAACLQAGIPKPHIMLDPGFGFGKTVQHNLQILKRLAEFQEHQLPVLLGVSRKSTIGTVLQKAVTERLSGGLAIAVFAALQGVSIIRSHDVDETNQALQMIDSIMNNRERDKG